MSETPGRSWGYWTRAKLQMLSDYLAGFATASKGQAERVYLDAFAGEGSGLDRLTGEFMEQARDRLAVAQEVIESGHPAAAESSAYYAMLNAARAALSEQDEHAKSHSRPLDSLQRRFRGARGRHVVPLQRPVPNGEIIVPVEAALDLAPQKGRRRAR